MNGSAKASPAASKAAPKHAVNESSASAFIEAIADRLRRDESRTIAAMMSQATGQPAAMWGTSIIGFGSRHYRYESGREGDTCVLGFSPRKAALTLYFDCEALERFRPLLDRLGKHRTGKSCLYITRLHDVDLKVLKKMFEEAARA